MKLELTTDEIEIIKGDLISCLDVDTAEKIPLQLKKQIINRMFTYLSVWDKEKIK